MRSVGKVLFEWLFGPGPEKSDPDLFSPGTTINFPVRDVETTARYTVKKMREAAEAEAFEKKVQMRVAEILREEKAARESQD